MSRLNVLRTLLFFICCLGSELKAQQTAPELWKVALQTLNRAGSFYRNKVASHGGYVYYYSADLSERWGEGKVSSDTIFVQPPGTPTVGMAYLRAFGATQDRFFLDAACEAAEALAYGQLESGGWTQAIHFGVADRMGKYRNGRGGSWNASSLDDGQTQAALRMLIRTDKATDFKRDRIHDAVIYGLKALLEAQFPNGAFPQVWTGPVAPHPVMKARIPDYDWKTEGQVNNYWDHYTLNDGLAGTVSDTLIEAHQVYQEQKYLAALLKLGDFLLLAQMPEPQPGWCQQYNYEMIPIWARKFEPPAITGWESQDVMETLIKISRYSGEKKYLEPIPHALKYYRTCLLPNGKIARYYEFQTNKPLYMDAEYRLTYDDSAAPSHYGWHQTARFDAIEAKYEDAKGGSRATQIPVGTELEERVRRIIKDIDEDGRWISTYAGESLIGQPKFNDSFRYISSEIFARNIDILSEYIATQRK